MNKNPTSKFKYCELELFSEIYYIGVVKLSMSGVVLPAFVLSSINYFVYGMGDDSFFLSYPIMYVMSTIDGLLTIKLHLKSSKESMLSSLNNFEITWPQIAIQLENALRIFERGIFRINSIIHRWIICRSTNLFFHRVVLFNSILCRWYHRGYSSFECKQKIRG